LDSSSPDLAAIVSFLLTCSAVHPDLLSFPTRRSSDLNHPSLRAFTYWYSSLIAAVSSNTFHAGIPLSGRPFSAVYSNESRGYAFPSLLNTHRRSGALGSMGCMASSPWQRKQYTWNHFHP